MAEDENAPVPPELSMAWNVERWGVAAVLGNKEIPINQLRRMNAVLNVYNAFMSYNAGKYRLVEWTQTHPSQARLVNDIRQMRQNGNR